MASNISPLLKALEDMPGSVLRPSDLILSFVNNTKKVFSGSRSKKWFKWRMTEGCRDSMNSRIQKYVNRLRCVKYFTAYTHIFTAYTHIFTALTHFLLHTRIFHSLYAY